MSLNVAYNQNINSGIDAAALKAVAQKIFQKSEVKSVDLSNLDFSKFKKADLGMDLYSNRVDAATASQVAMTNVGMQVRLSEQTLTSLKFLNTEASIANLKNVDGKIAPAVNEEAPKTKNVYKLPKFNQLVKTSDLGQDKNGSNAFYKGELLKTKKEEKTEQEEKINIFA